MFDPRFIALLEEAVGAAHAATAISAFSEAPSVAIRLHPSKCSPIPSSVSDLLGMTEKPVPWSPYGYLLAERPSFTLDPLFHAGAYYVQDSSAMFPVALFRAFAAARADRPLRVLDLCAAPGGKTTDLAASLRALCGDRFILVANEVMRVRATVLRDNVARWGDPCVVVTSLDPAAFATLGGWFDLILADVPCSGEGMFRKDPEAVAAWSEDNVALCAARQRRIIADAWPALAEDGLLIYSTCTFNRRENDDNVAWIAENLGADILPQPVLPGLLPTDHGSLLLPGLVPGEGQWAAVLRKTAPAPQALRGAAPREKGEPALRSLLTTACTVQLRGTTLVALPEAIAAELETVRSLRPLSAGVALGQRKGADFVPSADLALCTALSAEAYPRRAVDRETALRYLHRDALAQPDAPKGFVLLTFDGVPLGFVKNLGTRCNNLLPPERRIRMDIG